MVVASAIRGSLNSHPLRRRVRAQIRVEGGIAETRCNFLAVRIMHDGDSQLFATGRYLDRIAIAQTPFRFIERLVILDSQKIDTLLVLPL